MLKYFLKFVLFFFLACIELNLFAQKVDLIPFAHESELNEKRIRLWGYRNSDGDTIIKPKFNYVDNFNKDSTARVLLNSKIGIIDFNGNFIIPPEFDDIVEISEDIVPVKADKKWGFINLNNEIVIPFKYKGVGNFFDGKANVLTFDDEIYTINKKDSILNQLYTTYKDKKYYPNIEKLFAEYDGPPLFSNLRKLLNIDFIPIIWLSHGFVRDHESIALYNSPDGVIFYEHGAGYDYSETLKFPNTTFDKVVNFFTKLLNDEQNIKTTKSNNKIIFEYGYTQSIITLDENNIVELTNVYIDP